MINQRFAVIYPVKICSGTIYANKASVLIKALIALCLSVALNDTSFAETTLETQVIKPRVGHTDSSGLEVVSIDAPPNSPVKIAIALPPEPSETQSAIEEVIVIGEQPEAPEIPQSQPYEIVNDIDNGRSGIVIYLGKRQDFALRINYTEPKPDIEPDHIRDR